MFTKEQIEALKHSDPEQLQQLISDGSRLVSVRWISV